MSFEITEDLIARQTPEAQLIIRLLLARIEELEARLGKTPRNSSLPPSSQHPHAKPPAKKKRRPKRKRGGQRGHLKAERPLIPTEQCADAIACRPTECRRCGGVLAGDDPDPLRHQVWELPDLKPVVIEYQQHRLHCPCCRESTCGELPPGVPRGQSGPRLISLVALLMAYYRQSKRRTAEFVSTVFNIPCSASLTVKHQSIATEALRDNYDELVAALPSQPHVAGDETPTKQADQKSWLWTFVAQDFTVFALRPTRAATVLDEMLGEKFTGVMTCDRAKMYWQCGRLQWCWAHLKRDIQGLVDAPDHRLKRLGRDLMRPVKELFRLWARCRDGTLTRRGLKRLIAPLRRTIHSLLLRGHGTAARGMCRELFDHRDWLWAFLDVEGVEPTNNAAERSLRHPVIWRKLSFGTQSAQGSRFVETMLSVIETCRQQGRNVFHHVTHALRARFHQQHGPSLLAGV